MQKQFCCSQWLSGKIQISFGNLITGNRAHQDILLWLKINILKWDKTSLSYCNVIMVVYKNSDLIGPFVIYNLHHFSSLRLYCTIVVIYATYRNCIQCWDSCFPSQLNIEKSRGGKIARMIYQLSWTQCKCPIKLTWIVVLKQILPYNVVNIQFTVFSLCRCKWVFNPWNMRSQMLQYWRIFQLLMCGRLCVGTPTNLSTTRYWLLPVLIVICIVDKLLF